jgi:hypothetical protein
MTFGRWVLGAVAGGLVLGAVGAQAAPMPVMTSEAPASVQTVQFYYDNPPPVVYYDPPPRRYYGPPRERYYGPPREHWEHRAPRSAYNRPGPYGGFWDKEDGKDYVKDYRRAQKDIYKERVRAWNRANGY